MFKHFNKLVEQVKLHYKRHYFYSSWWGHGMDSRASIPGRGNIYFLRSIQTGSEAHTTSYSINIGVKIQGVKLTTHSHVFPRLKWLETCLLTYKNLMACTQTIYLHYQRSKLKKARYGRGGLEKTKCTQRFCWKAWREHQGSLWHMPTGINPSRSTTINLLPLTMLCSKLGKISTHGKV